MKGNGEERGGREGCVKEGMVRKWKLNVKRGEVGRVEVVVKEMFFL